MLPKRHDTGKYYQNCINMIKSQQKADVYYIYSWFVRASSVTKLQFIRSLISTISDQNTYKDLLVGLNELTRDVVLTQTQITKSSYDSHSMDDNRSLNSYTLKNVITSDLLWFKLLPGGEQVRIISDLVTLGGSDLNKIILRDTEEINNILDMLNYLKDKNEGKKSEPRRFKKLQDINRIIETLITNPNFEKLTDEFLGLNNLICPDTVDCTIFNNKVKNVETMQELWMKTVKKLITAVESEKRSTNYSKSKPVYSTPDKLQYLPMWVNRYIVHQLDNTSQRNLSNVDSYWNFTVEQVDVEKKIRQNLDKVILKLDKKLSQSNIANKKNNLLKSLKASNLAEDDGRKSMLATLTTVLPMSKIPFLKMFKELTVKTVHMFDRRIDCTKNYVASSEDTALVLYSLITGSKTTIQINAHTLPITCLTFFPKSFRMATGSLDKTTRTWNLWSRQNIATFIGHKGFILSVAANEEYLASSSMDRTIRVNSHISHNCIMIIDEHKFSPQMLFLSEENLLYVSSTNGSIRMLSVTDQTTDKTIKSAHYGAVSFIRKCDKLIVTAGEVDNFVKIWNSNFKTENCLVEYNYNWKVNAALVSHSTLISACDDGYLRFQHLYTGKIIKRIKVNLSGIPILDIRCQTYYNHIKITCSSECNIIIIQFPVKLPKSVKSLLTFQRKKLYNPYTAIKIHPLYNKPKYIMPARRLKRLLVTKCTLPEFRHQSPRLYTNKDSVLKYTILDDRKIHSFNRSYSNYDNYLPEVLEQLDPQLKLPHAKDNLSI